jgi:hypothetical protein
MKTKKMNQEGITHYLLPVLFVLIIAVIGVRLLTASHAATPADITAASSPNVTKSKVEFIPADTANRSTGITLSSATVSQVGVQMVAQVAPNAQLTFPKGIVGTGDTACYFVQAQPLKGGGSTATIEFNSTSYSVNKNIAYDLNNPGTFSEVCVQPGQQANKGFSLANLSPSTGPDVLVYEEVLSW